MRRELADGSSLMVPEIATRIGWAPAVVSKQLAILRKAGIVINPRGPPQFLDAECRSSAR
jgi:DNA-binding IscR family transcriptional regulator